MALVSEDTFISRMEEAQDLFERTGLPVDEEKYEELYEIWCRLIETINEAWPWYGDSYMGEDTFDPRVAFNPVIGMDSAASDALFDIFEKEIDIYRKCLVITKEMLSCFSGDVATPKKYLDQILQGTEKDLLEVVKHSREIKA